MNINLNEETLVMVENYMRVLDEQIGLKFDTICDIKEAICKQRINLSKTNVLDELENCLTYIHAHKHHVSKRDNEIVTIYFEDTNEEYEDYIVRSLHEVYGYDCYNNIDGGITVKLK